MGDQESQGTRPKANAVIDGQKALISNPGEGSLIYNKGYFGTPESGGSLTLEPAEAVYLVDVGRLSLYDAKKSIVSRENAFRWALKDNTGFEVKYLVYREMRQRGYVVKDAPQPVDFRVFPRGGRPNKTPTKYWLKTISERWPLVLRELRDLQSKASGVQKTLIAGVADEEGDVTYYAVSDRTPMGDTESLGDLPKNVPALFMEDRAMVFDPSHAESLHRNGWYGQLMGQTLQLSLIEAAYLVGEGILTMADAKTGKEVSDADIMETARTMEESFDLRFAVYSDLRKRGTVVKTGFKYGSHFRAYDGDPERHHARFLIQSVPDDYKTTWPALSGMVRLAHGVKKEILMATPGAEGVVYTRIRRITP